MAQVWNGVMIVLVCTAAYVFAFRNHSSGKWQMSVVLLMLCGLALRLYAASDPFLHEWDERYHALVAKNMLSHILAPTLYSRHSPIPLNYKLWTFTHIWLHKPPLTLWLIAASLKIFGLHAWAVRVPSVVLTTIGIGMMYDTGAKLYNRNTGFIAAFLYSIHGFIIELAAGRTDTDHTDAIFVFLITLGCWAAVRYKHNKGTRLYCIIVGMATGAAVLTKWVPGLAILPFWLILVYRDITPGKLLADLLLISVVTAAIALPWQVYTHIRFPLQSAWENAYSRLHFSTTLEGHTGHWYYYPVFLGIQYGELVYLPVLWFIYRAIRKRQSGDAALAALFVCSLIFYTIAATKMPGYMLVAAPAIFIMTAEGYLHFRIRLSHNKYARYLPLLLLVLPVRYSFERLKPFSKQNNDPDWNTRITKLAVGNTHNADKTLIFNCPHNIEVMFSTGILAYEQSASPALKDSLTKAGYRVVDWR